MKAIALVLALFIGIAPARAANVVYRTATGEVIEVSHSDVSRFAGQPGIAVAQIPDSDVTAMQRRGDDLDDVSVVGGRLVGKDAAAIAQRKVNAKKSADARALVEVLKQIEVLKLIAASETDEKVLAEVSRQLAALATQVAQLRGSL